MRNFALMGAAGFVAPRHMRAILESGNQLVMALDPSDSVGIIDSYFPDCIFYTDEAAFERDLRLRNTGGEGQAVDYVSICTPNYLHFEHISMALDAGSHAICEKPLVIYPRHLDELSRLEKQTGRTVSSIFQLRLHPSIIDLRDKLINKARRERITVHLKYVTRRGNWYHVSWKGDVKKSGGLAMNIGVHFFDVLIWIFGSVQQCTVQVSDETKIAGRLELENADVDWHLSIDINDIPEKLRQAGKTAYRSITLQGRELDFTEGFTDLHTVSYNEILNGRGIGLEDARAVLELIERINQTVPVN